MSCLWLILCWTSGFEDTSHQDAWANSGSVEKVSAVQARGQLNVYEHSLDGMPTCKHCWQKFSRWPNFLSHLLQSCPQLHGGNPQRDTGANNETLGIPQTIPSTEGPAEKLQGQTCRASAVDATAQRSAAGCILEPFQHRQPVIELIGTNDGKRSYVYLPCALILRITV